jgi:hypothetical protein
VQIFKLLHEWRVIFLGGRRGSVPQHLGDRFEVPGGPADLMTEVPYGASYRAACVARTSSLSSGR